MENSLSTVLPAPIVYAVAFSIIIIALAILIWLVITILFGTLILKKLNGLTKNISDLIKSLNEKGKQLADQTTETIKSYQLPPRTDNEADKGFKIAPLINSFIGIGGLFFEVFKIINLFKRKKEKKSGG